MKICFLLLAFFMLSAVAPRAEITTRTLEYASGGAVLEGYLAFDAGREGSRPGVLVVHEWYGLNDYARKRAELLAELGYVALAADIYGKGVRATNNQQAGELAGKYKGDRKLLRERVNAGLEALKKQPNVDAERTAAIGYCFGGTAVLELARSGAAVSGVVSFHGGLDSPSPEDARKIKCRVLACHGVDDPFVPPAAVSAFKQELRAADVDLKFINYPDAVHGFTNPDNANSAMSGVGYNAAADQKSWGDMQDFFQLIFR